MRRPTVSTIAGPARGGGAEPTMTTMNIDEVAADLRRFVHAHYGAQCGVEALQVMEAGHAGLTFGFRVVDGAAATVRARLILKLSPPGVRRAGNTDVHRQAPLLRALHGAGLPVPGVPWAGADEAAFGTPFVMMDFLPGQPFFVWQPDASFDLAPQSVAALWQQCIDALARLHRFDWQRHLPDWQAPCALRDEIERWDPILAKSPEPRWIEAGLRARDRLFETMPSGAPVGLVHGDYQPGNVLYDAGRLSGIIDWELASIGSRRLDVGWLMMLADRQSWHAEWMPVCPLSPDEVAARYEQAMGEAQADLAWHQALAGYRLGAIACLNVHLHRSGRRPDAIWERFALAIPALFARAASILAGEGVRRRAGGRR
jgi:aminoglycoside phosphotransferase (APT) family kinase protein